jgi:quinol monooxygenase YgiN
MAFKLFALLLVALACASAARMPDTQVLDDELPESLAAFGGNTGLGSNAEVELEGGATVSTLCGDLETLVSSEFDVNDKKHWPIRIVTKFLVKPELHHNFVHAFWRYQYRSRKNKGILHSSLSKVAGDNIVWTSYTVYEDVEALFDAARGEALRDFGGYLLTANIPIQYRLLLKIGGGRHYESENVSLDKKKHGYPIRLLTAYVVPPGEGCDFVKAWNKLEEDISDDKGNLAFSLAKPLGNNFLFVSYGAWDSPRALFESAKSKASRKFYEFLADRKIVVVTKKLIKVPTPF